MILAISACCLAQAPATEQPVAPTSSKPVLPNNDGIAVNNGYATSAAKSPPLIVAPTADVNAMTNPVAAANGTQKMNSGEQSAPTNAPAALGTRDRRSLAEIANHYRTQPHASHANKVYSNEDLVRLHSSGTPGVSTVPSTAPSAPVANLTGTTGGTVGAVANPAPVMPGATGQQRVIVAPSGPPPQPPERAPTRDPFNPPTSKTAPLPPQQAPPQ